MHLLVSVIILLISLLISSITMGWYIESIRTSTDKIWKHLLAGAVMGACLSMIQFAL